MGAPLSWTAYRIPNPRGSGYIVSLEPRHAEEWEAEGYAVETRPCWVYTGGHHKYTKKPWVPMNWNEKTEKGEPICPKHKIAMRPSKFVKNDWYCPTKEDDAWCPHTKWINPERLAEKNRQGKQQ